MELADQERWIAEQEQQVTLSLNTLLYLVFLAGKRKLLRG